MRHFIGLILGLALAAALFFGGGWGAEHVSALAGHSVGLPSRTGLIGLAAVLGVGLLMGILIACLPYTAGRRPARTRTAGLDGAAGGWRQRALAWIPLQGHAFGLGFRVLLLNGMLALAGIAMIVPMFLPARWHGTRGGLDDEDILELPAPTGLLFLTQVNVAAPPAAPSGQTLTLPFPAAMRAAAP